MMDNNLPNSGRTTPRRQLLSLTNEEFVDLARRIDAEGKSFASKRKYSRIVYESIALVDFSFEHPGGGTGHFRTYAVDLSANGMCLLHGGYVHVGSACSVTIPENERQDVFSEAAGSVKWCRSMGLRCHAVGIQFHQPIDLRRFVDAKSFAKSFACSLMANPSALVGRVLVVEDQEIDQDLGRIALSDTSVTIESASSGQEAIARLETERFDCLVVDLHLGDLTGEQVIADAKRLGFRNKIVVVTGSGDVERLARIERDTGAAIVRKPFDPQDLLGAIAHALSCVRVPSSTAPIKSTLPPDVAARFDLPRFIRLANEAADRMKVAIAQDNLESVRAGCQSLRSCGMTYGFPLLTEAGTIAVTALDATQSVSEAASDLHCVIDVVQRLAA